MPLRASNHERVGNARVMRGRLALAQGATPSAARLAETADAAFDAANRLAPADGLILTDQARGQLLLRQPERALATARRIIALYPEAATGHALEAAALLALGRGAEAHAALLRARDTRWEEGAGSQRRAVEDLLRGLERPGTPR
jgi:tetratricopeptide (TPR) repeat protein